MPRTRSHTRRSPRSNPRGVLLAQVAGHGFVQTAEGEYFVPASKRGGAFGGDVVELAPLPPKGGVRAGDGRRGRAAAAGGEAGERPCARVVRVVERAHDTLVGRYEVAEPFGVVVPADPRIPYDVFTLRAERPDIEDGALVRVRIATFPSRHTAATGVVEEVMGRADDEDVGIELIVARHKLRTEFPAGALEEARAAVLDEEGALATGYRDLRERTTFTIDPADARDFDDALSLEKVEPKDPRGAVWRLGVHIADVSRYVPWNSSLDLEARQRTTSVYLVDRAVPMLPPELSDDLCSLAPGKVRRTMTADLYLDERARVVSYELCPALICSHARLTYDEALGLLEGRASDPGLSWRLRALARIARLRVAARTAAGGLDFDTPEAKVRLDGEGRPVAIDLRRKNAATSLVEEAMILANETVARHLEQHEFPCLYRVHEQPSPESLAALVPVFQEFPWFDAIDRAKLVAGDQHVIGQMLQASADRPEGQLVSSLVLRSLKRAVYRVQNGGHYGLASSAYAHFTSPIRRYPDLVVHRMLKAQLARRPERFDQEVANLPYIAEHSSDGERVAERAARESQELKIIEYLQDSVGVSFSAVVSGVAAYGLYVRLENTAEGFVPVRSLGSEYLSFDAARHCLQGQDSGRTYRLGQRLPVTLVAADPRAGKLEFKLAQERATKERSRT